MLTLLLPGDHFAEDKFQALHRHRGHGLHGISSFLPRCGEARLEEIEKKADGPGELVPASKNHKHLKSHGFSVCFPNVPCREGVTLWALVGRGWVHVLRLKARRRQELMLEAIAGC